MGSRSLKIFSKSSVINRFGMPLLTNVWVGLAMLFPSAWWVVKNFLLDLNANYFLYPLVIGGIGCNVDALEKSDKAKTEVSYFVSLILTSCIVMLIIFSWLSIDWLWCDPLKEEALLWHYSDILNLEALIRGVMLTWSWEGSLIKDKTSLRICHWSASWVNRHLKS